MSNPAQDGINAAEREADLADSPVNALEGVDLFWAVEKIESMVAPGDRPYVKDHLALGLDVLHGCEIVGRERVELLVAIAKVAAIDYVQHGKRVVDGDGRDALGCRGCGVVSPIGTKRCPDCGGRKFTRFNIDE